MCGQSTVYNTYATLSYTNPLFMGFSGYQNVNSSSQRDRIICELQVWKRVRKFTCRTLFSCLQIHRNLADDRLEAERRGGSCAGFADNPPPTVDNNKKSRYNENIRQGNHLAIVLGLPGSGKSARIVKAI